MKTIQKQRTGSTLHIVIIILTLLIGYSCNSCYDERLKEQYSGLACTADCPGVVGCDGKTYCNECEANRMGIRVD